MTYYLNELRREIDFILRWLQPGRTEDDLMTASAFLDLTERVAATAFAPHYKNADTTEPRQEHGRVHVLPEIAAALEVYAESGFPAAGFPAEFGGLELPHSLCMASFSIMAAANISTSAYSMLSVANARLIAAYGSPRQIETFALPQIEGRWTGTMCLSEPQAGSSLADIRTRAVPVTTDELGAQYRLTGSKMWISGGDHDARENIVHLVLAKIPRADGRLPDGTKGISLFIVPRTLPDGVRNDVVVAGLNHKMGYRGIPNCLLNFGEGGFPVGEPDGAVGWLIGGEGDGLRQMFGMMNEARISVGIGAAALGYRGFRHAVRYARERVQGRPPGQPTSQPPVPIIDHADVRRMLLQQKIYSEGALAIGLYCATLVDQGPASEPLLALLTPIAKSWPAVWGLVANDLAIQVHGGYGYTRDFDVEQLWRDNRLNPIHEGTTGIQALDLLGRKIVRDRGGVAALEQRVVETAARALSTPGMVELAQDLRAAWSRIRISIDHLREQEDQLQVMNQAGAFLEAFGHAVVGWLWLDQALACLDDEAEYGPAKLLACRFFFETELPKIELWLRPVDTLSTLVTEPAAARL